MAREFLSFHNQLVAHLPPHDEDDNLVAFYSIQGTQISYPQLKVRQRIGSQPFDGLRRCFGLMFEPGKDRRFQDSPVTSRQGPKLSFAVLGERNLVRHLGYQGTSVAAAGDILT